MDGGVKPVVRHLTSGAVVKLRRRRVFAIHTGQLMRVTSIPKVTGLHCQNARTHHSLFPESVLFSSLFPSLSSSHCLPRSCSAELLVRS